MARPRGRAPLLNTGRRITETGPGTLFPSLPRFSSPKNLYPTALLAQQKAVQALKRRVAGQAWPTICLELGYKTELGAQSAVRSALKLTVFESASEYRQIALERLREVLQHYWPGMEAGIRGDTRLVLDTIADIRELLGLDAPVKVETRGEMRVSLEDTLQSPYAKLSLEELGALVRLEQAMTPDQLAALAQKALPSGDGRRRDEGAK